MSEKWVSALFSKLQVRYGHKWTSALPTPELTRLAVTEWSEKLAGLSGSQVKHGLDTWEADWPPSCDEFRKLCVGEKDALHKSGAYKDFVALPKPEVNRELGSETLAEIKKIWCKANE